MGLKRQQNGECMRTGDKKSKASVAGGLGLGGGHGGGL